MDLQQFKDSLSKDQPQETWNFILKALWYDAKGDWHKAHDLADGPPGEEAAWVHAYFCLLYTSPSPRDATLSRMPSSA